MASHDPAHSYFQAHLQEPIPGDPASEACVAFSTATPDMIREVFVGFHFLHLAASAISLTALFRNDLFLAVMSEEKHRKLQKCTAEVMAKLLNMPRDGIAN